MDKMDRVALPCSFIGRWVGTGCKIRVCDFVRLNLVDGAAVLLGL